jgi:hypothetical protein
MGRPSIGRPFPDGGVGLALLIVVILVLLGRFRVFAGRGVLLS